MCGRCYSERLRQHAALVTVFATASSFSNNLPVHIQASVRQGEWEATKQVLAQAIKLIEELDNDDESSSAAEALFFAILCLQLQAAWHLHHKVGQQNL